MGAWYPFPENDMTNFIYANNINTTLATAISSSATSITLASAANLPASIPAGSYLAITLNDAATRQVFEIMYATAVSGSTLTVLRAQEGTAAQSWLVGDYIFSAPTAGEMATVGLGVTSFNTRTGAVTLTDGDVTTALGYVPYSTAGGTVSGSVTATGSINAATTFSSTGTTGILSTGAAGTLYLRPNGPTSATGQVVVAPSGNVGIGNSTTNPGSGVGNFAAQLTGAYGGGVAMINGTVNWGIWIDASGTLIFGYATSLGALTPVFGITSGGNLVALGTIQGGTTPP